MAESTMKTNPGPLPMTGQVRTVSLALVAIGLVSFGLLLTKNAERAWYAYLVGYFYFFSLAIGGMFFTAIQHLTKAGWSVNVRRFCEAFTAFLPIAAVGALILVFFGGHHIYEWLDKVKVAADELLTHKSGYLNFSFFLIRVVIFFGLWMFLSNKLVGNSVAQDKTGDEGLTVSSVPWSIAFLLTFAISFSLFSVDLLMSLQPHWYSTIFGVYCFSGMFQSTIAAMILFVMVARKAGLLEGFVDENHMHDLGKFLFAFTVFWAYIAFSQYMLMWYANLPEETSFYLPRVTGPWTVVSASLLLFKFVVPFLALLSRRAKRNQPYLAAVAILVLVMQYVDLVWLAYPNLGAEEVKVGILDVLVWLGFGGAFLHSVRSFLAKHSIIPVRDPRIVESLHHHVVY